MKTQTWAFLAVETQAEYARSLLQLDYSWYEEQGNQFVGRINAEASHFPASPLGKPSSRAVRLLEDHLRYLKEAKLNSAERVVLLAHSLACAMELLQLLAINTVLSVDKIQVSGDVQKTAEWLLGCLELLKTEAPYLSTVRETIIVKLNTLTKVTPWMPQPEDNIVLERCAEAFDEKMAIYRSGGEWVVLDAANDEQLAFGVTPTEAAMSAIELKRTKDKGVWD